MWVSFVAGGLADLAATFFVVPMEVVVQRLQIQDPHSKTKYKGGIGNLFLQSFKLIMIKMQFKLSIKLKV